MTRSRTLTIAALAAIAFGPRHAAAQAASSQPFTGGWRDGFAIQSESGDYRVQLGFVGQLDGRFVPGGADEAVIDTFVVRKVRPILAGRLARYFDFQVMPDFGNGTVVLQDAYFDLRFSPALRVRTGKAKSPVGYELLVGDPFVLFPERSLASSLVPNRDVGIHVLGDVAGGRLFYQAGVFNGVVDGGSSDLDASDSKDVAGRIVVRPFGRGAAAAGGSPAEGLLSNFGVALAGSAGEQEGALPAFRTSVGQRYFGYAADAAASGGHTRLTPAIFYYYGPLGAFAEYVRSTQSVARGGSARDITNQAWNVTVSYVLTGETGADRGVRPLNDFDPPTGGWGALQLVARFSRLSVDRAAFAGLAAPRSSRQASQAAVGANWYPVAFIKYYVAVEHIAFEGPAASARDDEVSVVFRAQIAF